MEITINSNLDIKTIIDSLESTFVDGYSVDHRYAKYNNITKLFEGMHVAYLNDDDFPELSATMEYNPSETYALITTAWSDFTYELTQKDGYTQIRYIGAYKGFMAQNLLPKLGELDYDTAKVSSSLTKNRQTTFREYFMIREEMDAPKYGHKHPYKVYRHFAVNAE